MEAGFDAVVLAGGRASRMGGVDKLSLRDGDGITVLDRVLAALDDCGLVVVVGPEGRAHPAVPVEGRDDDAGAARVVVLREDPPFGGPAAALAAALPSLRSPWVLVLAGDQPRAAGGVAALRRAVRTLPGSGLVGRPDDADERAHAHGADGVEEPDGVVLVDGQGRRQWLCAAYRTRALVEAASAHAAGGWHGAPVRAMLGHLRVLELLDTAGASDDVDTPEDAERLLGR